MAHFSKARVAGSAAGLAAAFLALAAATPIADMAHQKFNRIGSGKLPTGTRVDLSSAELNAWAADEARLYAPGATRDIRLRLGAGSATAFMTVDFLKLRQAATGESPGWLMRNLFSGERPVMVSGRFESGNRRARVDVDRVEVSGVPIEGATLNFLIENFLRPTFPDVKVNEWFALGFHIDRFTVLPAGVSVFVGK